MRSRDHHKKKAIKYNSKIHWDKYKSLQNKANIQLRESKAKFYHKEIGDCAKLKDFKKMWSLINSLTGKNKKSTSITEITVNNKNITDSKLSAESFSEYFVNIGPKLASEASEEFLAQHATNYNPSPTIDPIRDCTFYFHHVHIDDIAHALMRLKPNIFTCLDKIPAKVVRLSADITAPSLTYIFNLSLDAGIYVDEWKRVQVKPIYKSEDRRKCENYRPIFILPIVSKVFEREVFRQLYGYLSDNSLLAKYFQSGFRPKHSTLSALIRMCDDFLKTWITEN
jgi:hypothetical protein